MFFFNGSGISFASSKPHLKGLGHLGIWSNSAIFLEVKPDVRDMTFLTLDDHVIIVSSDTVTVDK